MKNKHTKYYIIGLAIAIAALFVFYKPAFVPPPNVEHNADGSIAKHHDDQQQAAAPAAAPVAQAPAPHDAVAAAEDVAKKPKAEPLSPEAATAAANRAALNAATANTGPVVPHVEPARSVTQEPPAEEKIVAAPVAARSCRFDKNEKSLLLGLTGPAAVRLWRQAIGKCNLIDYKVHEGDSLSAISLRFFGDTRYWTKIWSNNPSIDQPYDLQAGTVLLFERDDADSADGTLNWYEVQPEDKDLSFGDLAERLGNRAWADEIARQNPKFKNQAHLQAGQSIRIDTERLKNE